jgi:deoxycytidylate deaminase
MGHKKHDLTAIIYDKRGRVLSVGKNSYVKTHPVQKHYAELAGEPYKQAIHAEIAAIIKCKDLSKAHSISIFRFNNNGEPALAKPCKICSTAIEAAGIFNITHT